MKKLIDIAGPPKQNAAQHKKSKSISTSKSSNVVELSSFDYVQIPEQERHLIHNITGLKAPSAILPASSRHSLGPHNGLHHLNGAANLTRVTSVRLTELIAAQARPSPSKTINVLHGIEGLTICQQSSNLLSRGSDLKQGESLASAMKRRPADDYGFSCEQSRTSSKVGGKQRAEDQLLLGHAGSVDGLESVFSYRGSSLHENFSCHLYNNILDNSSKYSPSS